MNKQVKICGIRSTAIVLMAAAAINIALLQACSSGPGEAPVEFSLCGETAGKEGLFRFIQDWDPVKGISLRLGNEGGSAKCVLQIRRGAVSAAIEHGGGEKQPTPFIIETSKPFEEVSKDIPCVLEITRHSWKLFIDGIEACRVRPPFVPFTFELPEGSAPSEGLRFQQTAKFFFHDDFMIEEKSENPLDNWEILSGEWHVHTALEVAKEQAKTKKINTAPLQPERSSNFYSIKGSGKPGLIAAGYPFHNNYSLQASVLPAEGDSGLAFYIQDENNFHTLMLRVFPEGETFAILSRHREGKDTEVLKAVRLHVPPGQWFMPRVEIMDENVKVFVDGTLVMELAMPLPPGGQFGLYTSSEGISIFDDVSAESLGRLDLSMPGQIKLHTVESIGDIFSQTSWWQRITGAAHEERLFPGKSRQNRHLILGSVSDQVAVSEMTFLPVSQDLKCGIISGWQGKSSPSHKLVLHKERTKQTLRYERLENNDAAPVTLAETELPPSAQGEAVSLKIVSQKCGLQRLYFNGLLRMTVKLPQALDGASGVFLAQGGELDMRDINISFSPEKVSADKPEKNQHFTNDPFMRHWASPAGEWIKDAEDNSITWHKSDFFRKFTIDMPVADNSEVHIGAETRSDKGEIILRNSPSETKLFIGESEIPLVSANLLGIFNDTPQDKRRISLTIEDFCAWAEADSTMLFNVTLPGRLSRSKIYLKGFSDNHLATLQALRSDVLDFHFSEAPHAWIRNGGAWQVINRFQCDPRWSHMNGESADDLASLWAKYRIEGDFCVEMYAGMRHGAEWYDRVGDLNLTVMNREYNPSSGYTFICSGWDPDHSQKLTRFLRNSRLLDSTDKYLSPRVRDGNVRRIFDPVIARGRDVHGAWYYIKARRVKNTVEYYFDNEKVFSFEDPELIESGGIGIWTFMNSMMVARVRVAASSISFGKLGSSEVPASEVLRTQQEPITEPPRLTLNGLPANLMTSKSWEVAPDAAGAPKIAFKSQNTFTVTNTLGGGKFAANAKDIIHKEGTITGWQCKVKSTRDARFNFHFELGLLVKNNEFSTIQRFFHHICGDDYDKGLYQLSGRSFAGQAGGDKHESPDLSKWRVINIPLPNVPAKFRGNSSLLWRVVGFGNMQPGDIVMGLGDGPGDSYSVADFNPIFLNPPEAALANADDKIDHLSLSLPGMTLRPSSVEDLNKNMGDITLKGIVSAQLEVGQDKPIPVQWVHPESLNDWECRWDSRKHSSIIISSPFPFRALNSTKIDFKVNGFTMTAEDMINNEFHISITESTDDDFRKSLANDLVEIQVQTAEQSKTFNLQWKDCPNIAPPLLVAITGITPLWMPFESQETRKPLLFSPERMSFEWEDDIKRVCLQVANSHGKQRLSTGFKTDILLPRHPVLQFIYKADPMANISLRLDSNVFAKLSEPFPKAKNVRFSSDFRSDGTWRYWTGLLPDAFDTISFSNKLYNIANLTFGSFHNVDQTGQNSRLMLSDITMGPAVNSSGQLAFTPHYFSISDTVTVETAILSGQDAIVKTPEDPAFESANWIESPNKSKHTPDISKIDEGLHQLVLRATDSEGRTSPVSAFPFIYVKTPPSAKLAFKKTDSPEFNDSLLKLQFDLVSSVPVDLSSIQAVFKGKPVALSDGYTVFKRSGDSEFLEINWPFALKNGIQTMNDQDIENLVLSGMKDGTGNKIADMSAPIKIDFATDKHPPTYLKPGIPASMITRLDSDWNFRNPVAFAMKRFSCKTLHEEDGTFARFKPARNGTVVFADDKDKKSPKIDGNSFIAFKWRFNNRNPKPGSEALRLQFTNGPNNIVINLKDIKSIGQKGLNAYPAIPDGAQWQTLVIDIKSLLKSRANKKTQELAKTSVKLIRFEVKDVEEKYSMDLLAFSVFKKSSHDDKIRLDGYDSSGIAGVSWKLLDEDGKIVGEGDNVTPEIALSSLPGNGKVQWLFASLLDRAGNRARPMIFPLKLDPRPKPPEPKKDAPASTSNASEEKTEIDTPGEKVDN
ncbi:MAG: hypothetical protein JW808_05485 [Victivallales bacterium]|nr:hypothetical protein [Victivallales bacterium]